MSHCAQLWFLSQLDLNTTTPAVERRRFIEAACQDGILLAAKIDTKHEPPQRKPLYGLRSQNYPAPEL
jgi:hypothetical protein